MQIVTANPYRILGVYANSATKLRVSNLAKAKAFLKVGKPVEFPVDFATFLGPVERNEALIRQADRELILPAERIRFAQFWFVNTGAVDEKAFAFLAQGDAGQALRIWSAKTCAASLQNRIVVSLVQKDFKAAAALGTKLYEEYADDFLALIDAGETEQKTSLGERFFECLMAESKAEAGDDALVREGIAETQPSGSVAASVRQQRIRTQTERLNAMIGELAKLIDDENSSIEDCREKAEALMAYAGETLPSLKADLADKAYVYDTLADRLAKTMRDAAVNYYNRSPHGNEYTEVSIRFADFAAATTVSDDYSKLRADLQRALRSKLPDELAPQVEQLRVYMKCNELATSFDPSFRILRLLDDLRDECRRLGLEQSAGFDELRQEVLVHVLGHALIYLFSLTHPDEGLIKLNRKATADDLEDYADNVGRLLAEVDAFRAPGDDDKVYNAVRKNYSDVRKALQDRPSLLDRFLSFVFDKIRLILIWGFVFWVLSKIFH